MPNDYTLSDLVKLSGVSPRTVRYYIQSGLLPAPAGAGPAARYSEAHLGRLRIIRRLQNTHLPLAEIRRQLDAIPDERIASAADTGTTQPPADSALDYVTSLLGQPGQPVFAVPLATTAPPAPAPAPATPEQAPQPDRAQWERIRLDPDIEIHVRRPLSRLQNKRVERLISIAQQLLEED